MKVKNPNAIDGRGRTPLHVAAARGHAGVAKTLLNRYIFCYLLRLSKYFGAVIGNFKIS